jgi:hypothetical protein
MQQFVGFHNVRIRDFKGLYYADKFPGLPIGTRPTLLYVIDFTKGIRVDEVVSMVQGKSGDWQVSGYSVAPLDVVWPF